MNDIKNRLQTIQDEIRSAAGAAGRNPDEVLLVSVSKRKSAALVKEAVDAGVTILGENYIQEAIDKIETLGEIPAAWHFIGHLQSNKARFAVKHFDLIHTVDSLKLAREINKQAKKIGKVQKILIQINISEEASKSGTGADEALALAKEISPFENVSVRGLMGMPPFFDAPEKARPFFKAMAEIKSAIEGENIPNISMEHLSMGMSGDFRVAIEEGATMVRIGTAIFGERD
ncbi:MAG: YggS family pyridoxal phosphate-dependent enzyme [Desulfobacteraceae bacterium]|nr:YggS family pyridoxal phosphate-dependent enzyme [Desulfobacteraceae bacterium]